MAEATLTKVKIQPLGDRVLVKPVETKEVKRGGIIIPDTAKEKPQEGEVVAVGKGKSDRRRQGPAHGRQAGRPDPLSVSTRATRSRSTISST